MPRQAVSCPPNVNQAKTPDAVLESLLSDAHLGSEHLSVSKSPLLEKVCVWLSCPSWVCELAREIHSFLYRSRTLIRLRTVPLNSLGPQFGVDATGRVVTCTRTLGRRLDTHKFQSRYCHSSPADLEMFLAGWNAGARWCDEHSHQCVQRNGADSLPCMTLPPDRVKESKGGGIIVPFDSCGAA